MNKFNGVINLLFGHGNADQGSKKIWRFILMLIMLSILTYLMPGHLTYGISTGSAFILYFGSLVYFDKTSLTKTLAISYKKQVAYTYFVTLFFIFCISLILYSLILFPNFLIGKNIFIFSSINEALTFFIMSCTLYLLFIPLCFVIKNGIWTAYFIIVSIVFIITSLVINNITFEKTKLLTTLIILIATIFISYKFSCLFNKPRRYCVRRNID